MNPGDAAPNVDELLDRARDVLDGNIGVDPVLVEEVDRVEPPEGADADDGPLQELQDVHNTVTAEISELLSAAAGDAAYAQLFRKDVHALTEALPARCRQGFLSYGLLTQASDEDLILNDAYAGHGMLYGRFLAADELLGGQSVARLRRRRVLGVQEQVPAAWPGPGLHLQKTQAGLVQGWGNSSTPSVSPVLCRGGIIWGRFTLDHPVSDDTGPCELGAVGAAVAVAEHHLSRRDLLNAPKYRLTIRCFDLSG